jgi:hypothetical protein
MSKTTILTPFLYGSSLVSSSLERLGWFPFPFRRNVLMVVSTLLKEIKKEGQAE